MADYCYTKEEALEELRKKNVDPDVLVESFKTKSLKALAKETNIGHVRLRCILQSMGVDMTKAKTRKIAKATSEVSRKKRLEVYGGVNINQFIVDYNSNGLQYCREKYGSEITAAIVVDYRDRLKSPHGTTVRTNKKISEIKKEHVDDIKEMMDEGYAKVMIARKLDISLPYINHVVSEIDSNYEGDVFMTLEETEAYRKKLSKSGAVISANKKKEDCKRLLELYNSGEIQRFIDDLEANVSDYLDSLNVTHTFHRRDILTSGKEIDIYVDNVNLGIEINPTYTHNSTISPYNNSRPKSRNYHYNKHLDAIESDVTLIQLYDSDLLEPRWSNCTKPFLKFKILGADTVLYGRDVQIEKVFSRKERKGCIEFIEKYHSQGKVPAKDYYRFMYNGSIVGVASFSEYGENGVELKRLVFRPGFQIRYGISKLVSRVFKDLPDVMKIYTYSRNDMGTGKAYEMAGFKFVKETGPTLSFVNLKNPVDVYSWSVATSWSAKSGVLSRAFGPLNITNREALTLVNERLPHRYDNGHGYVSLYNSGNKLWVHARPLLAE